MKKCLVGVISVLMLSGIIGCYQYVAEHPTKPQDAFYEDRRACEELARTYAVDRQEDTSVSDEISYARSCMRSKGWKYQFRKN